MEITHPWACINGLLIDYVPRARHNSRWSKYESMALKPSPNVWYIAGVMIIISYVIIEITQTPRNGYSQCLQISCLKIKESLPPSCGHS